MNSLKCDITKSLDFLLLLVVLRIIIRQHQKGTLAAATAKKDCSEHGEEKVKAGKINKAAK